MTTEHRRAPRRKVTNIEKTGPWGKVVYLHHLECGHTESRKRAASTSELACAWCLRAKEKDKEIKSLSALPAIPDVEPNLADEEIKIEKLRSVVAARFAVPSEAIDISVEFVAGNLVIRHGIVYLSATDLARLANTR